MTEEAGRNILKQVFERAGLAITEDFALADLQIRLDGYDPARRIGYEFLTSEAGDRAEVSPPVVVELEARMRRGELAVLLIDEADVGDEADLARGAEQFLATLRQRGWLS